jgi:hypothetical protein
LISSFGKNDALRFPILVAGIAFAINEHFDKILLEWLDVSKEDIGAYAACYKLGCSWFCLEQHIL